MMMPGMAGDPVVVQESSVFGDGDTLVLAWSNHSRSGALATAGFGRNGTLVVLADVCRWRLQLL